MIGLQSYRYIAVWIRKVRAKNIVFNPQYEDLWDKVVLHWNWALNFKGNKQNFEEVFNHLNAKPLTKKIPMLDKNISFQSYLPQKTILLQKNYKSFLKNKTLLLVEKFSHPDAIAHLGSSRHALLGNIQIKGVGRNMLVSRLDYVHSWGGMFEIEAYFSYLVSNFLDRQLPYGACATFKVDQLPSGSFQILRNANGYRVSQFSSQMDPREIQVLKKSIVDPLFHLKKNAYQFAYSTFCNIYNYSMIAENILLDGRVIDCESIYTPPSLSFFSFYLDLCIKGEKKPKINKENLNQWSYLEKVFSQKNNPWLCNSSVHGPMMALKKYEKIFSFIYPEINLHQRGCYFYWDYLNQLMILFTGKKIESKLMSFLQNFSLLSAEVGDFRGKSFIFNWKKQLSPLKNFLDQDKPFDVFFLSEEKHQLFLRIRFNIKRPPFTNQLLHKYNSKPRLDMLKEAALFMSQEKSTNAIKNSSALNHEINRSLFVVPSTLNKNGKIEIQIKRRRDLTPWLKNNFPGHSLNNLILSWTELTAEQELINKEGLIASLPNKGPVIINEVKNLKTGFCLLTKSTLII